MDQTADIPAYNQLLFKRMCNKCLTLGPYLQQARCGNGELFFDSLAECATPKADPEKRKYYGWVMHVRLEGSHCYYRYYFGLNTPDTDWEERALPKKYTSSVNENLQRFFERLEAYLIDQFEVTLAPEDGVEAIEKPKPKAKAKASTEKTEKTEK